MGRIPGMVDVAREAGVSHVTVSRVLNDHPSVRPETRARVEAAIEKLGYRPNSVARALKTRRSSTIGVVLAGVELYELPRILRGVQSAAQRAGYWVNLASWQGGTTRRQDRVGRTSVATVSRTASSPANGPSCRGHGARTSVKPSSAARPRKSR